MPEREEQKRREIILCPPGGEGNIVPSWRGGMREGNIVPSWRGGVGGEEREARSGSGGEGG